MAPRREVSDFISRKNEHLNTGIERQDARRQRRIIQADRVHCNDAKTVDQSRLKEVDRLEIVVKQLNDRVLNSAWKLAFGDGGSSAISPIIMEAPRQPDAMVR